MDDAGRGESKAISILREHYAWILIALALLLFCTKTLFNGPLWLIALIGLYRVVRTPQILLRDPALAGITGLFLCLWLPMIVSLPDAVNLGHSSETVLPYPHFLFAAIFMVQDLRNPANLRRLAWAAFAVVSFWCLDALLQFVTGRNLLGYPYTPGQLSGMFYPKIRLGHVLAMLLPVYIETARRAGRGKIWPWLCAGLLLVVLLLSGKRVAWLMGGVSLLCYAIYLYVACRPLPKKPLVVAGALLILSFAVLVSQHQPLSRRLDATLGLFSGDLADVERATAHRVSLWATALRMAGDHWINGVGPRGYRYVYADYAREGDVFLRGGRTGQTHPHIMLLEIAAETGVPGLAGFIGFWWLLLRHARNAIRSSPGSAPWLIAAGVAWLPFNAHLAFYGSYWSSAAWWMLAAALAAGAAACPPGPK